MIEEGVVVVAEGRVPSRRTDGTVICLASCDVFEVQGGRIRNLTCRFMETR